MAKRALSLILALTMFLSLFCLPVSAAVDKYGSIPILIGYADADYMAEQVLSEIPIPAGADHRTVIRTVYDWIIRNCDLVSPDGRAYFNESTLYTESSKYAAITNTLIAEGQAVIRPELTDYYSATSADISADSNYNIAVFAYEMMMYRAGNSAHFSALLALLLGHLGYDCRVIAGTFTNSAGVRTEHKWNCVLADGQYYWLDVHSDYESFTKTGIIDRNYFMVTNQSIWDMDHSWDRTYSNALFRNSAQIVDRYNTIAHTHEVVYRVPISATCTEPGRISHYECTSCGKFFRDRRATQELSAEEVIVEALGHDWGSWEIVEECTWNSDGLRRRVCRNDSRHTETETYNDSASPFADVPGDAYYLESVLWASENGITSGTDATHFSPNQTCTRAQVVTFLWRAAGSPEPKSGSSTFYDVRRSDYYYKAVLWAVEQGITSGVGTNRFAPNDVCTRAQVVTFLYRAAGSPAVYGVSNPFSDVRSGDYYYNAVRWAVRNNITSGIDATHFGPGSKCTRAQVVTFLYRANT